MRRMKKKMNVKLIVAALSFLLLLGGTLSGSLAWLLDRTNDVNNTFTTSNINIELSESENLNLKMVPGWTIDKDPQVTVYAGSEACYLFVKVEKSENFDDFMTYEIASEWTKYDDANGTDYNVYHMTVDSTATDAVYPILKDNNVAVRSDVTNQMMSEITTIDTMPTLTFTAYAVQLYKSKGVPFELAEAWDIAKGLTNVDRFGINN